MTDTACRPTVPPTAPLVHRRLFLRRAIGLGAGLSALGLAACTSSQPAAPPKPAAAGQATPTADAKPAAAGQAAPTAASKPAAANPAPAATQAPAVAVRPDAELVGAIENAPPTLDHEKESAFWTYQAVELVYDGLLGEDRDLKIIPGLAESWENPTPVTWTFKLRDGVTFHDGKAFTAEDVQYSLGRTIDKNVGNVFRNWFQMIEKVEAVDRLTVRLTLSEPNPALPSTLAALRGSLIMPAGFAEQASLKTAAVGTGPYRLAEYVTNSHISYVRHDQYWRKGFPKIPKVTFKFVKEEPARLAAIRAGSVAYAERLSAESAHLLERERDITVSTSPTGGLYGLWFNPTRKPFDDARVRRALSMALDRREIVEKVDPTAAISGAVAAGSYPYALKGADLAPWFAAPQVEEAKKLLAEAGYPNGFKTTITSSNRDIHVGYGVVARENWKKIGVDAEVQQLEFGTWIKEVDVPSFKFDIRPLGWTSKPDALLDLMQYYLSTGDFNVGKAYKNEQVDQLIGTLRTATGDERANGFKRLQKLLDEDAVVAWLFQSGYVEATRANLQGYYSVNTRRRYGIMEATLA